MKLITAIIRTTCLETVIESLEEAGIRGITIMDVRGTGEQVQLFKPYTIHKRLDIFVSEERTDEVVGIILEKSHTGLAGDGVISVLPVDYTIKIRTSRKEE